MILRRDTICSRFYQVTFRNNFTNQVYTDFLRNLDTIKSQMKKNHAYKDM